MLELLDVCSNLKNENIIKFNKEYLALYTIERNCTKGSNNFEYAFAVFKRSIYNNKIVIVPEKSFPSAKLHKFPKMIDTIFVKSGQLWFTGRDYNWGTKHEKGKGDALCCPSLKISSPFISFQDKKESSYKSTKIKNTGEWMWLALQPNKK